MRLCFWMDQLESNLEILLFQLLDFQSLESDPEIGIIEY